MTVTQDDAVTKYDAIRENDSVRQDNTFRKHDAVGEYRTLREEHAVGIDDAVAARHLLATDRVRSFHRVQRRFAREDTVTGAKASGIRHDRAAHFNCRCRVYQTRALAQNRLCFVCESGQLLSGTR